MSASTVKKNRQMAREQGIDKKAQAAQELAAKKAKENRKWAIVGSIVVVVLALVIVLNSGFFAKSTTAVTIGDEKYDPGVVSYHMASQYYTWANTYSGYAELLGLDTSSGLAGLGAQVCSLMENGTWLDYFTAAGEQELLQIQALCKYADANGITLTEEEIAQIDANMEETKMYAELMGYGSEKNFYVQCYGQLVTPELAREEALRGTLANKVLTQFVAGQEYTSAELEEQYKSYNGDYDFFNFSYYNTADKAIADKVLAAYNKAEGDSPAAKLDAALVEAGDEGSAVHKTNAQGSTLSASYNSWLMEQSKSGSAAVLEGSAGDYFVVVFDSREDNHYNLVNIRHILVKAGVSEDGTYSDTAKAEAKAKAEEILAQWKAGEATEESFAALANELSEDSGSNTNGGLYENVTKGQMVQEFDAFCFGDHKAGDTGIVYGESGSYAGYHVMYYVGEGGLYSELIAKDNLNTVALEGFIAEQTAGLEIDRGFGSRFVG